MEEQPSKGGRALRCGSLNKAIRERKRGQRSLPQPRRTSCVWHGSVSPNPAWNRWEILGIPWIVAVSPRRAPEWHSFQDALSLSVTALQPGWEGQDLGLPLLHVLGKKSGAIQTNVPCCSCSLQSGVSKSAAAPLCPLALLCFECRCLAGCWRIAVFLKGVWFTQMCCHSDAAGDACAGTGVKFRRALGQHVGQTYCSYSLPP